MGASLGLTMEEMGQVAGAGGQEARAAGAVATARVAAVKGLGEGSGGTDWGVGCKERAVVINACAIIHVDCACIS